MPMSASCAGVLQSAELRKAAVARQGGGVGHQFEIVSAWGFPPLPPWRERGGAVNALPLVGVRCEKELFSLDSCLHVGVEMIGGTRRWERKGAPISSDGQTSMQIKCYKSTRPTPDHPDRGPREDLPDERLGVASGGRRPRAPRLEVGDQLPACRLRRSSVSR